MPTKAKPTKHTLLKRGDGGGTEVFTTVGEVRGVKGPSTKVADIDATSYDSTAVEVVPDIPDHGEITFEMLSISSDTMQQGLITDMEAGTLRNFKITRNDHATVPSTRSFAAYVTGFDEDSAARGAYLTSVTLRISGAVTRTFAAAS